MNRALVDFHEDENSDWVAELACGHRRHMRHDPPFRERPWVVTSEGRQSQIGSEVDCAECDRRLIPAGYEPYRRTAVFDETTVPEGLRRRHTTKPGVWARIEVTRGALDYYGHAPFDTHEQLTPAARGVVLPEVEHHVDTAGPVSFFLEFWRPGASRT